MSARPPARWVWRLSAETLLALAAVAEREGWGTMRWADPEGAASSRIHLAELGERPTIGWVRRYGGHQVDGPDAGTLREIAQLVGPHGASVPPEAVAELAAMLRRGAMPTVGWWRRVGGRRP